MKSKKLTFGDVLAEQIPNTHQKVSERWMYLQSEYNKKDKTDAFKSAGLILVVMILIIIGACLI